MKYSDFLHLEDKLKEQTFNTSYKTINTLLTVFSYLGNLISIFLAFFFLFSIISIGISNIYISGGVSILLLIGLELFKRDVFKKFSFAILSKKKNIQTYVSLLIFSLLLIFMSFYSSLTGAKMFSNKNTQIENTQDKLIENYRDSIYTKNLSKNNIIEKEINFYKEKLIIKDNEQFEINKKLQSNATLSRSEKDRNVQLTNEKTEINSFILKNELLLNNNSKYQDSLITNYTVQIKDKSKTEILKNSNDSIIFILLSTIIEFVILFGVFFNVYFLNKSYTEYKKNIQYDPIFQKWYLYNEVLNILYPKNIKINQRIQTLNSIIDMCKINNIYADKKEIESFLKLCNNIGIITQKGSYRYIMQQYDSAYELLKTHFNIK
jgi:hypothetical protein